MFCFLIATYGPMSTEAEDINNISKLDSVPIAVKENIPVILELRSLLK